VDEDLTGIQNLTLIGRLLNLSNRDAKARGAELLEWFDLAEASGRTAKTYSGGMRRRLDLAASLVGRPAVIFLDEPTTGLDPAKREDMWDVIRNLVNDGSTVLLTTQYLDEADALADEISVIDRGRVIAHDTPEGLKRIIGGQRIRVVPTDAARLDDVGRILTEITGTVAERTGRHEVTVPVTDDGALAATVQRLTTEGIAVTELSLHLPSLDEVFLTLTGDHHADDGTSETTTATSTSTPTLKERAA
ncbi:MAG: ATP-binding cassette domain-containing protein, partial [Lapillicoccus sp.]